MVCDFCTDDKFPTAICQQCGKDNRPPREEIVLLRDTVRECRDYWGYSFSTIGKLLNLGYEGNEEKTDGVVIAACLYLDILLCRAGEDFDAIIADAVSSNVKAVADYRGGKKAAIGSLVGVIKKKHSHLNAKDVQAALVKRLDNHVGSI
jgi:hypothetical protein